MRDRYTAQTSVLLYIILTFGKGISLHYVMTDRHVPELANEETKFEARP